MALSEFQQAHVTKRLTAFCDSRVPPAMRDKPRIGFRIKGVRSFCMIRPESAEDSVN
jgi:hypothetical protein